MSPVFPDVLKRDLANARVSAWNWKRRYTKLRHQYTETCRRFHAKRSDVLGLIDEAIAMWDRDMLNERLQEIRDLLDPKPSDLMPPPGMGTRG